MNSKKSLIDELDTEILEELKRMQAVSPYESETNNSGEKIYVKNQEEFNKASPSRKRELIEEVFKEEILPVLAGDHGSATIEKITQNHQKTEVVISYMGACHGCPSAAGATLLGISGVLKEKLSDNIDIFTT